MYKVPYTIIMFLFFFFYVPSLLYIIMGPIAPPILHMMVSIYRVSYVLLWVHLMYADCGVLLLYIRWSTVFIQKKAHAH